MGIAKRIYFTPSLIIFEEDAKYLCKEARNTRWGEIPKMNPSTPGDEKDCAGCPIWIRWACTKCNTCMYWLDEED